MSSISSSLSHALQRAKIDPSSITLKRNILTSSDGSTFFTRTSRDIEQITGEVESLRALSATCPDVDPTLHAFEIDKESGEATMISQHFDLSGSTTRDTQRELARRIARLHSTPTEGTEGYTGKYGFHVPTHCGVTEQDNTWEEEWEVFFRDRRLGDLVRRIGSQDISEAWEKMKVKAVPLLLHDIKPAPKPVILHGDLWSGNTGVDAETGKPVIYDPSSYYGHNEADLGIMHMFGGFGADFFDEYHKIHPRSEPYYDQRQKLYELYHHLNHGLMFGEAYKRSARAIMQDLIDWADNSLALMRRENFTWTCRSNE